jgi:hypothetical protein
MQEHRVTAAGDTMRLPEPFFVLATQNPIEQEGTYPLPEAQLDRFLFDIRIGYPNEEEEVGILRSTTGGRDVTLEPVLDAAETSALQRLTRELPAADPILRYAAALARATRPPAGEASGNGASGTTPPDLVKRYVRWGAGPRGGQALYWARKHTRSCPAAPRSRPTTCVAWRSQCFAIACYPTSPPMPTASPPSRSWRRWCVTCQLRRAASAFKGAVMRSPEPVGVRVEGHHSVASRATE